MLNTKYTISCILQMNVNSIDNRDKTHRLFFSIDPGIKSTVYCTAIAEGGIEEWEFALRRYKTENLAAEKSRLQSALACSKETWILSKYVFNPYFPSGLVHAYELDEPIGMPGVLLNVFFFG